MENILRKGRALQLDGIIDNPVKVTLGFKCEGHEKIALAQEAHQAEMTLSEYVEYIVSLRHTYAQSSLVASQDVADLKQAAVKQNAVVLQLQQGLLFYENNKHLQRWLSEYKGKRVLIKDVDGKERSLVINEVADVFEIMVNSFKTA